MSRIVASNGRRSEDSGPQFALQLSDEQLEYAVMTALLWDLAVPRHRVIVRVNRGWVTLTGQVERAYEKSSAEADARSTPGVVGVINKIDCNQAT
jgi:osmotically-inducible protein OsmY